MNQSSNGQEPTQISDSELVPALQGRISQLVLECAAKDAYIARLRDALAAENRGGGNTAPQEASP